MLPQQPRKHRVKKHWMIDPTNETVSILGLRGGALVVARTVGRNQTLQSSLLAGFELDLDTIFSS